MAIPGNYYIIQTSDASRLNASDTREPLNPSDTSNLRRNKTGTKFIISTTEAVRGADYIMKFANREAMIDYINSTEEWITDDMEAGRTEQQAVTFNNIMGVQRASLLHAWTPKQIMYAGTRDEPTTTVSQGFQAGTNTDTSTLAIRKWNDSVSGIEGIITTGYVGGDASQYNRTELYSHSMIYNPGRTSKFNIGIPNSEVAGSWTMLFGLQPGNHTTMNIKLMGDSRSDLTIDFKNINKVEINHRVDGTLAALPLTPLQVVSFRSSPVQMYPIFVQWDGTKYTVPVCTRTDGSATYTSEVANQYTPADAYIPVFPTSFHDANVEIPKNYRMNEMGSGRLLGLGCLAMWNTMLSNTEMETLDNYILSL